MAAVYGDHIQGARKARTVFFHNVPQTFLQLLEKDIQRVVNKAHKRGLTPAIRLNGTSDINWSTVRFPNRETIFERFPDVQFYDYTKSPSILNSSRKVPNWHITFSYSGANDRYRTIAEAQDANLAVVFGGAFPETFLGRPVIDGDKNDLRFLDPEGVIVGLKAKGEAKKDTSGFVVPT
jgi:fructose-specific component phosphotransferase system IIB-like protein